MCTSAGRSNGDPGAQEQNENSNESRIRQEIAKLNHDLIEECKRCTEDTVLSKSLRAELDRHNREFRAEVARKTRNGCAPLFVACKRGCVPIAQYLISNCDADIEQHGHFEVPEDHSFHYVSPLWCAVVSGKLNMVKYLVRIGCDINATSDSGSTPVRSACYMTHLDIVQFLVENGADIKKPNMNGGNCLINSVQSIQLCLYLMQKGADVNAKDIQDKTALHYAIQEHRLETAQMLIDHGADPYAKSRYGDDALRTACIKGAHQIFDYLKANLEYTPERLAEAHELIGTTFLDEHNESRVAILHWRMAHHIRTSQSNYIEKRPKVPRRRAYLNAVEFTTLEELDSIAIDIDAMRIQSLLITERILGITHKDMLFRLTFRGASYADGMEVQRCIDLWSLLLDVRVRHWSVLHFETCFASQALVRLMLDMHARQGRTPHDYGRGPRAVGAEVDENAIPRFEDVFSIFRLVADNVVQSKKYLQVRPVFRRQQENYDRVLKCVAHLTYLLIHTVRNEIQHQQALWAIREFIVFTKICSACTSDSLLHLCVSRLNVIRSGYITDENNVDSVFPNARVIQVLLECGMNVNSRNEGKSTPLHVAVQPYNFSNEITLLLLEHGADLDQPNRSGERPYTLIASNPANRIPLLNFLNLKCLAATVIGKYKIPYRKQIPKNLETFVKQHEP